MVSECKTYSEYVVAVSGTRKLMLVNQMEALCLVEGLSSVTRDPRVRCHGELVSTSLPTIIWSVSWGNNLQLYLAVEFGI